jgi:hypothetical protein
LFWAKINRFSKHIQFGVASCFDDEYHSKLKSKDFNGAFGLEYFISKYFSDRAESAFEQKVRRFWDFDYTNQRKIFGYFIRVYSNEKRLIFREARKVSRFFIKNERFEAIQRLHYFVARNINLSISAAAPEFGYSVFTASYIFFASSGCF